MEGAGTRRQGRERSERRVTLPKGMCTRRHTHTYTHVIYTHIRAQPHILLLVHTHTGREYTVAEKEESKLQGESRRHQVFLRKLVLSPQELQSRGLEGWGVF